jgi:hypothetical protein
VPRDVTVRIQDFGDPAVVNQTFEVFDIPDALRGRVQNVIATIPGSVGGGDFNFDTIQFALNKRFPNGLFVQGSFDYQWRDELRANTASNSPLDSDPLNVNYFQNVYPTVPNRQSSTNWQGRLLGRYQFANDFGAAVNWRVQSGWAYARLVSVPLPNAGTQVFFLENIDTNRSHKAALLDLRVDKSFRFGRYRLMVMGDLFNVTNSNAVTNFNLSNGANYGRINATLDPRTAMIGARFDF